MFSTFFISLDGGVKKFLTVIVLMCLLRSLFMFELFFLNEIY